MKPANRHRLTLRDMPFEQLVQTDPQLVDARREHSGMTASKRRAAAQWAYDSAMAGGLFAAALLKSGHEPLSEPADAGVFAMAIDPLFAPTLLTVGSIEYQYGHVEAAMEHFLTLTALPETEPDLGEIVDKAGDFLFDQKDYRHALRLYEAAVEAKPCAAAYWTGVSYCLGKLRRRKAAVAAARQAVALDPSAVRLNDLGWSLVQAREYGEARSVLKDAVAAAPAGYDLPCNNLTELERRARRRRGAGKGLRWHLPI